MTSVALVTITYQSGKVWSDFIDSVVGSVGIDWHLYVIDNNSSDDTGDILDAISDDRISITRNNANEGVAAANNIGIRAALASGCDYILLLNNDIVFGPSVISGLVESIREADADAMAPLMTFHDDPQAIWFARGRFTRALGMLNLHEWYGKSVSFAPSTRVETDFAPTTFLLFRPSVFRKVGLQDDAYFAYWEDTDFLWRMRTRKMKVLVDPSLSIAHKVSQSTGGHVSPIFIYYNARNQIYFTRKHLGMLWASYTMAISVAKMVTKLLIGRTTIPLMRAHLRGIGDGWRMPNKGKDAVEAI